MNQMRTMTQALRRCSLAHWQVRIQKLPAPGGARLRGAGGLGAAGVVRGAAPGGEGSRRPRPPPRGEQEAPRGQRPVRPAFSAPLCLALLCIHDSRTDMAATLCAEACSGRGS